MGGVTERDEERESACACSDATSHAHCTCRTWAIWATCVTASSGVSPNEGDIVEDEALQLASWRSTAVPCACARSNGWWAMSVLPPRTPSSSGGGSRAAGAAVLLPSLGLVRTAVELTESQRRRVVALAALLGMLAAAVSLAQSGGGAAGRAKMALNCRGRAGCAYRPNFPMPNGCILHALHKYSSVIAPLTKVPENQGNISIENATKISRVAVVVVSAYRLTSRAN